MQQDNTGYSGWTQGGMQGAASMAPILGPVSQQEQVLLIRESMMSLSGEQSSCCPCRLDPSVWLFGTGYSHLGPTSLQWRALWLYPCR